MTEKNSTAFSRREFFTALQGVMVMMVLVQKQKQFSFLKGCFVPTGFLCIMFYDPYVDNDDFHRDDRNQCSGSLTEKVDCAYWVIIAMV